MSSCQAFTMKMIKKYNGFASEQQMNRYRVVHIMILCNATLSESVPQQTLEFYIKFLLRP